MLVCFTRVRQYVRTYCAPNIRIGTATVSVEDAHCPVDVRPPCDLRHRQAGRQHAHEHVAAGYGCHC